jgi:cbb3-type cytochrome oxidase cytochrome c subunit
MKNRVVKLVVYALAGFLVIAQLFRIDKTNPPVDASQDYLATVDVPAEAAELIRTACYDCHSNETAYPWYTNVAPASWWIKKHINDGRKHLNFSVWGTYEAKRKSHKMEECYEMVEEGEMPMDSYTWMHGEAKLSSEQKAMLVDWFKKQEAAFKE